VFGAILRPLSILSPATFYDHHMLYHAYLALFASDGSAQSLILGAKLASIVMPALAFVAIWWLLGGQGVRWPALWTFGLFGLSEPFLHRMSMPRAQAASLLVLALALHWLLRRRYAAIVPLGFAYVWLYNAFPLLLGLGVAVAVAGLLSERRFEWRALAYPAAGIALGLVLNPYVPQTLAFIINHLAPKIGSPATSVGNEWYPRRRPKRRSSSAARSSAPARSGSSAAPLSRSAPKPRYATRLALATA
jgi:hypothetical protein